MIETKRINNLEFKVATYLLKNPPEIKAYHINRYMPNCYAIARFEYNKHEGVYEFTWVGERPLDLTEQEEKDFKELIIYGFNKLNHGSDEGESDY